MEFFLWTILPLVFAGVLAGLLSGIFSVGGGVIIVPVLYHIFIAQGASLDIALHTALGTSLATITLTQARAAREHHRRGSFDVLIWRRWAVAIVLGTIVGGVIAGVMSGAVLAFIFGTGMLVFAAILYHHARIDGMADRELPPARWSIHSPITYLVSFLSGVFSALTGVGGGTVNVSALALMFRVPMHKAIGVSAALGVLIGLCGTLTFMAIGSGKADTLAHSVGFVHLPAAFAVVVFSLWMVPVGVAISHKASQRQLKGFFALLLVLSAVNMFFQSSG